MRVQRFYGGYVYGKRIDALHCFVILPETIVNETGGHMAEKRQPIPSEPRERVFVDEGPPLQPDIDLSVSAPAVEPIGPAGASPPAVAPPPDPADFFLSCMDSVEQQRFLDFCALRQLTPAAGILLFLKEPLQRDELNPLAANPFADDAQAVVDMVQHPQQPQAGQLAPPNYVPVALRQKPMGVCEVCGSPFMVKFQGRKLCDNETCWHTYHEMRGQVAINTGVGGITIANAENDRRLSKLEKMMERIAGALDRLVGA